MDPTAARHIQCPSGIAKQNKQGRRPGKIACAACHARKKRCDISPPYHQCTHCRKEDQCCVPRDPIDSKTYKPLGRPTRRRMSNRNHNSQQASDNHENQFHVNGFLPRGIDHEIPRWSAVYSSYSEMRRLLPSLTSTFPSPSPEMEEDIAHRQTTKERKRNVSSSGVGSSRRFQSGVLYRDYAESTSSIKGISIRASRSLSPSPAPVGERVGLEKALACEAEMHGDLTSMREVRVPNGGGPGSTYDVFMNDLDALLRF
ncbi:hypothetical protein N7537_001461 [Penicillium hordei]|uniref:Zn(2)-C6 fungal-type domain-containing protein n=1 Tax=Penicillium hordei TaxID=40994 RepID=A0AAD6EH83_9EURO|nr:uncharacterized protein N7537_001461 [Penicillium hordei]KAJ5616347.1 hypothetical protein N7537_001461 [Penicillium hordei]